MKKLMWAVLLLSLGFALAAETVDRIVARVGDDIILLSDLTKQMSQMKSANALPEDATPADVLNEMIENRLVIQKAKELNYKVDDTKIKAAAEKQIAQIRKRFDTEDQFLAELRKLKLTQSDLLKYLTDQMTEQALSQQFFQKQIQVKVMVNDKEMLAFYNAHKDTLAVKPVTYQIGMIMRQIEAGKETDKAQYDAIRRIQDRIKEGESFEKLAQEQSQCPSASAGGDLGFFSKGMMVKPFEDAAFALKVGEVSDIVKTQYGYHLIKLEERRGDEIRVRHILRLLTPSLQDTLAAKQQMEDIRQQYLNGTPFARLAQDYSQDKESAQHDGIIGEYSETQYPELFAPVLSALPVCGISDVLENEGMLYLFSKLQEIPSRVMTFEEVRSQIKDILTRQKQMQVYSDWINKLRKENHVEILL